MNKFEKKKTKLQFFHDQLLLFSKKRKFVICVAIIQVREIEEKMHEKEKLLGSFFVDVICEVKYDFSLFLFELQNQVLELSLIHYILNIHF